LLQLDRQIKTLMKIRSKLVAAVVDYLAADVSVPVAIHPETGVADLSPPYAVVRISTAEPLAPGEPVWSLMLLVAVSQNADETAAADAETAAEATFAPLDFSPRAGEENEDAELRFDSFALFCEARGLAISAFYPEDSSMSISGENWQHVAGFQVIAAEI